ncbi:MarR family winged helix-turn-helix transcriptional regulator [Cohnella fermenti]|uniref:MarR family transcriptional regulator n=1 Tax=Cohnella fermenti TaxID=2565925 RepID=A0A4S4C221_9BACL|nr:MarR family transcriptional regulator [Cohnella fermenti]THF81723.1 MarR family transcriptional regulator [Cohnella fermenti]
MNSEFRVDPDMIIQIYNQIFKHFSHQRIRRLSEHLREHDLSLNQFSVLNLIYRQHDCSSMLLANRLHLKAASMTYIVDSLVKRGLANRIENPEDRRSHFIALTEEGEQLVIGIEEDDELSRHIASLDPDKQEMLYLSLRVLRNVIFQQAEPCPKPDEEEN